MTWRLLVCARARRREVEDCDELDGFLLVQSLAGGTGAGLGTALAEALRDDYPGARLLNHCVWPYESGEFEPTEELYHLAKDPHELTNLAPQKGKDLKKMRARYDDAVEAWRRDGVDYNGYQPYGDVFDRKIPWKP